MVDGVKLIHTLFSYLIAMITKSVMAVLPHIAHTPFPSFILKLYFVM